MSTQTLAWVVERLAERRRVVIASVIDTSGSVPGKVGAKLAIADGIDGFVGTVGGAGLEMKVIQRCNHILYEYLKPHGEVITYGLNKGAKGYEVQPLDSLCGGRVTLSIEVLIPTPHILMMGGGHCAKALANSIDSLNWKFSITDSRPEFCNQEVHPKASENICSSVSTFLSKESFQSMNRFSDILLLGHDWVEDQERLLGLLQLCQDNEASLDGNSFPRIGVIGSRSKWNSFSNSAQEQGIKTELLDLVICPIGLNIGAESPEEIAIAVTAQILSLNKGVSADDLNWRQKS